MQELFFEYASFFDGDGFCKNLFFLFQWFRLSPLESLLGARIATSFSLCKNFKLKIQCCNLSQFWLWQISYMLRKGNHVIEFWNCCIMSTSSCHAWMEHHLPQVVLQVCIILQWWWIFQELCSLAVQMVSGCRHYRLFITAERIATSASLLVAYFRCYSTTICNLWQFYLWHFRNYLRRQYLTSMHFSISMLRCGVPCYPWSNMSNPTCERWS